MEGLGPLLGQALLEQAESPPALRPTADVEAARRTAVEFESFFLSQVLDQMFAGVRTDGLFGGGHAEKVYRSLLNQEHGKAIARAGGVGIADAVQREILKLQEVSTP